MAADETLVLKPQGTDESLVLGSEATTAVGSLVLESTGESIQLQQLQGQGKLDLRQVFGSIHNALVAIIEASNASRLEAIAERDDVAERIEALGLSMDAVEEETSRAAAAADFSAAQLGKRFCIQYTGEVKEEDACEEEVKDEEALHQSSKTETIPSETNTAQSTDAQKGSKGVDEPTETQNSKDARGGNETHSLNNMKFYKQRSDRATARVDKATLASRQTRQSRLTRPLRSSRGASSTTDRSVTLKSFKTLEFEIVQEDLDDEVQGGQLSPGSPSHLDLDGLRVEFATLSDTLESRFKEIEDKVANAEFLCNILQKKVRDDGVKREDVEKLAQGIVDEAISKLQIRSTIKSKLEPIIQQLQEMKDNQANTLGITDQAGDDETTEREGNVQWANAQRRMSQLEDSVEALTQRLDSTEAEGGLLKEQLSHVRDGLDETKEMNRTWTDGLGALKEEMQGELNQLQSSMESTQSGGGQWVTDQTLASNDAEELLNLRSEVNEENRRREEYQRKTSRQIELMEFQIKRHQDSLDALWWRLTKKGVVDVQDGLDKGIRDALNDKANALEVMKLESEAKKMGKTVKQLMEQTKRMQEQWEDNPDCVVGVKCLFCGAGAEQMRVAGALELLAADRNEALMRTSQKSWKRPLCTTTEPLPPCEGAAYNATMKDNDTTAMSRTGGSTWNSQSLPSLHKGAKTVKTKKLRSLLDAGQRAHGRAGADF